MTATFSVWLLPYDCVKQDYKLGYVQNVYGDEKIQKEWARKLLLANNEAKLAEIYDNSGKRTIYSRSDIKKKEGSQTKAITTNRLSRKFRSGGSEFSGTLKQVVAEKMKDDSLFYDNKKVLTIEGSDRIDSMIQNVLKNNNKFEIVVEV
jgi:hypothetical protein